MDAHLFRRFCDASVPFLTGARLEKLQSPVRDVFTLTFFAPGGKRQLCMRSGRQNPLLFFSSAHLGAGHAPTADIMRLRKYALGHRIGACVPQYYARRLWLLVSGAAPAPSQDALSAPKLAWLVLDLKEGVSLHFLTETESPEPETVRWPEEEELASACANWRDWPVMTPALRRTLLRLDALESLALLEDLRSGGGDLFLYRNPADNAVRALSAWPLPPDLHDGLVEQSGENVNALLEEAGRHLVLERMTLDRAREEAQPLLRKKKKLDRLAGNLDEEKARLNRMVGARHDGLALQENLWRWPRGLKEARIDVPEGAHGPARSVALDARITVVENMERFFHTAERGKRGLAHLAARRAELDRERNALSAALTSLAASPEKGRTGGQDAAKAQTAASRPSAAPMPVGPLPKNVQAFVSSDGFVILRGRDAKGNLACRKLAAPHDIWMHAEGGPGAHVVVRLRWPGQEVPARTLMEAGCLAALKSWQNSAARADIQYAEIRHIKPMRGAPAGTVRIDRLLGTLSVPVNPEMEKRLSPALRENT
ncbi:MAG: NFACT RNA binding domain-containing protein [Desulfovibrio sp.]|nr:NFACT RNA binding domain-containing protein [Desulfovibrio sp.]